MKDWLITIGFAILGTSAIALVLWLLAPKNGKRRKDRDRFAEGVAMGVIWDPPDKNQ